jgi:hypothetical protein
MRSKFVAAAPIALAALLFATLAIASSPKRVYINCYQPGRSVARSALIPRQHPTSCVIQGETGDAANLLKLREAHWSHWAGASTRTTGQALNTNPQTGGSVSSPVSVMLYRIRQGCRGHKYYTRAAVTTTGAGASTGTFAVTSGCQEGPVG